MLEKEFIPYQEALALKELGFDEPCFGYRESTFGKEKVIIEPSGLITNTNFSKIFGEIRFRLCTPTYSQAFRWFREKYDLFISIVHYENGYSINDLRRFETYEEAELECLRKLIELYKKQIVC